MSGDRHLTMPAGMEVVEDADLAAPGEGACAFCATIVDLDELFCGACGSKLPGSPGLSSLPPVVEVFRCRACRASTVANGDSTCAYCGSSDVVAASSSVRAVPMRLIPFSVVEGEAQVLLRSWVGFRYLKPAALTRPTAAASLRRAFVPHWLFTSDLHTYWTADVDDVPSGRRGAWAPAFGETSSTVTGLLVSASGVLPQRQAERLGAYDLRATVPYEASRHGAIPVEAAAVPRRTARAVARSRLIAREHARSAALLAPRKLRHLRVNPLIENMQSTLVLLPAWVLTYHHRGRARRFVLNGQSGIVRGTAPLCAIRLAAAAAVIAAMMLLAWLLLTRS